MNAKKPTPNDREQSKLFIEKAREIGADKESRADALIGRLARTPPQPHSKSSKRKRISTK